MKKLRYILIGFTLALIVILSNPVYASDPIYDWINGKPVVTDNTNYEWINGVPYIIIDGQAAGWTNISSINSVSQSNISTIIGTAKTSIASINGVTP